LCLKDEGVIQIRHFEYIILGGGPGGLQLGYYFQRRGYDYCILEAGSEVASFFRTFPRHRKLISINKVSTGFDDPEINLRWDWNSLLSDDPVLRFTKYSDRYFPSADDMVRYLGDFAARVGLNVLANARVVRVSRPSGRFLLEDASGRQFSADRLVVATGLSMPVVPAFPGSEHVQQYATVSIEPEDFRNQRVMIIGKGNSGFETADRLVETTAAIHMISPTPVRLAWRSHYVGHLRAVNNNLLDTYQLKSQNTILDARIERIVRVGNQLQVSIHYTHAEDERREILVDSVIACCGFRFDPTPFVPDCKLELALGEYPAMTGAWESVNVPGVYFAGTLMHMRDYRRTFSGFIHGFRYNIKALADIIAVRHHGGTWQSRQLKATPTDIVDALMARVHANSALFQQPGFISDVVVLEPNGFARYNEDMPIDLLPEAGIGADRPYFALTMEYGHDEHADPFNIVRHPADGARSHFIHPVLRLLRDGALVAEHHVPEDLENDWRKTAFFRPLQDFVAGHLGTPPSTD
jgi:thioredoxin reductase